MNFRVEPLFPCTFDPECDPLKPPPPPPPPPAPSSDTNFPILAITILGILAISIPLLTYYVLVIKCRFTWRRSDVIARLSGSLRRSQNPPMAYSTAARSRGLDESAIRAIPTFRYRRGGGGGGGDDQGKRSFHDCAVCLNEFQEDERIRLLPNCLHLFHIDCIDAWLQTNANCPLCRSDVAATTPLPVEHLTDLASRQNLQHSGDIVIEINNDGIDEAAPAGSGVNADPSPRKTEQRAGHNKKGRKLHHPSSMGDECLDARGKDERFDVQPMRRSFSMGSSSDRQLCMA